MTDKIVELRKALGDLGFTRAAQTTQGGKVLDLIYFNSDGVRVEIDFRFTREAGSHD